ncbi:MAG TPA: hypothetical protein VGJ17_06260, partial [Candidatus Limnocylindrales bacterium]
LVIGGAVVAVISMDFSRRAEDVAADELEAEATMVAGQLRGEGRSIDAATVAEVLLADRHYRRLPPPDHLEAADPLAPGSAADADADDEADDVGDRRRGGTDEDLTPA